MTTILFIASGLFLLMGLGLLVGGFSTTNPGMLLGATSFGLGGGLAIMYLSWWPLLAGFLGAALLRFLGLDPGY